MDDTSPPVSDPPAPDLSDVFTPADPDRALPLRTLAFSVVSPGGRHPAAQGNHRIVRRKGGKAPVLRDSNAHLEPWRAAIIVACRRAMASQGWETVPKDVPVAIVRAHFVFPRPAYHYRTGRFAGQLKDWAPTWVTVNAGDWDKLGRGMSDSLTMAGAIHDDCQIVAVDGLRVGYGPVPGLALRIMRDVPPHW